MTETYQPISRRSFLAGCMATAAVFGLGARVLSPEMAFAGDDSMLGVASLEELPLATQARKKISISTNSLMKGKRFTLTYMPYNGKNSIIQKHKGKKLNIRSVQNFAITPDGKNCFTTSECYVEDNIHTLLCRAEVPSKKGSKAQAKCVAAKVLDSYGHGEGIDVTQPDLSKPIYHVWVACTGKSFTGSPYVFGTEIARITYDASKDKITKTVKIGGFGYASTSGGKAASFNATPMRLNVSVDVKNNRIMFRIVFADRDGQTYVVYDYEKLNAMLDKLKNGKKLNVASAARLQIARIYTTLNPHNSFQGFATAGNYLFIQGGNKGLGGQIYQIPYTTQKPGKVEEQTFIDEDEDTERIIVLPNTLTAVDVIHNKKLKVSKSELEVEGLKVQQVANGKFMFRNVWWTPLSAQHSVAVYQFTR